MKNYKSIIFITLTLFTGVLQAENRTVQISSPDNKISIALHLSESDGKVTYSVQYDAAEVIATSALGIQTNAIDFTGGLSFISEETREIDETYFLPSGKTKNYRNHCRELAFTLAKDGNEFQIILRAYNDGIAYRYVLPGRGATAIDKETSEVRIAAFDKCWGMEYVSSYEKKYPERNWQATSNVQNNEFCAPVLVKNTSGNYCLITEAANFGTYCTSKIKSGTVEETGKFYYAKTGEITSALPMQTPWRTVVIGSLSALVESVLVENLNPPTLQQDLSWIEPGIAAWDWAENDGGHSSNNFDVPKKFIDLAYKMGWKYFVLDEGWENAAYPLVLVTDYAKLHNVKPIIWSHHNRFQNDSLQIRSILKGWKDLGFAGVKIDFWEDDSQTMMQKYDKLLAIAGELQLLVDLHGCTKPSGTRRYYPHLITSEAIYGGEQYYFNDQATPASHNITVALTRNVIGPMDYTPVEFARTDGVIRHTTTWSHQVALAVLYESGLLCMADSPENYLFASVRSLLKVLPAAWDETKCPEAIVDQRLTIARRNGADWYVASVSQEARTANIPLDFLDEGDYTAQIFKDGNSRSEIAYATQTVNRLTTLNIPILEQGGVTIRISKTPIDVPPVYVYEAENGTLSGNTTIGNDSKHLVSGDKMVQFLGNGSNTLTINNINMEKAGKYDLTVYFVSRERRDTYVKTNDGEKIPYSFPGNGFSWEGDGLAFKTVTVELQTGNNTIEFGNDAAYGVNIDRITLSELQTYAEPAYPGEEDGGRIRVACIGNSITQGVGTPSRSFSYPTALQDFLGSENYEIRNFGVSGYCMLRQSDRPYWRMSEYQYALMWNPDIVIIKLGTNDTNDYNWNPYKQEFKGDYTDFINSFKNLSSHPKIYVCYPVPIYPLGEFKSNVLLNEMMPLLTEIATETESEIIDLYTPFQNRQDLFADDLHPNIPGARWLAYWVAKALVPENDPELVYANALQHDLTDEKTGIDSSVNGLDVSALFDNDASTVVTVPYQTDINFSVNLPALTKLTNYSITISDEETGQKRKLSWVLEGKPSSTWYKLDEQTNVEFLPNETKWFSNLPSYNDIRQCKTFRLIIKDNDGRSNVALREWQLFGSRTGTAMETSITNNGGVMSDQYGVTGNEGVEKLNDRSVTTKYCAVNKGTSFWLQYVSPVPVIIDRYKLISANDYSERDPRVWELQGSNDGHNWTTLDRQERQIFAARYSEQEYKFDNNAAYTHFRLQINKMEKETCLTFQLAEWQLFEKVSTGILPHNIRSNYRAYTLSHQLYIRSDSAETVRYKIYNIAGELVAGGILAPASEIKTDCRPGIYLIAFIASSGKSVVKTVVL